VESNEDDAGEGMSGSRDLISSGVRWRNGWLGCAHRVLRDLVQPSPISRPSLVDQAQVYGDRPHHGIIGNNVQATAAAEGMLWNVRSAVRP
jgi:hypothetical protein